jgi:hypothetical protein
LFFRRPRVVVLERDARVNRLGIEVVELGDALDDVGLNGFGQCDVVGRKYQFHVFKMDLPRSKIQFFL